MIANALLVTVAVLLALGFWLMDELKFLIPYRRILVHQYGPVLLLWLTISFVNLFTAVYAIQRKFFLKDTGRKLSHVDRQVLKRHFSLTSPEEIGRMSGGLSQPDLEHALGTLAHLRQDTLEPRK